MTLQVGMLAKNGIVLVGDVWTYTDAHGATSVWAAEARSKITLFGSDLAVSRAHDLTQARMVSDAIGSNLTSEYWENPEARMEEIARSALSSECAWRGVQCLVVLRRPSLALFKVECARDPGGQQNVCSCSRSTGHVFAGDCHNPATFWATRYLLTERTTDHAIKELLPLAVQIVVDAGRINNGSIRGLEIVSCDDGGFHRLSESESRAWAIEATRRGQAIERLVTAPLDAREYE